MTTTINPDFEPIPAIDSSVAQGENASTFGKIVAAALVYPAGGWTDEVEVLTVEAGQTKSVHLDLGASCISIVQPVCVDREHFTDPRLIPLASCYTISAADTLPVSAKHWRALGGDVRVVVNKDTTSATLTVTGMTDKSLGPFTLGLSDGDNDFSTLRLIGRGVALEPHTVTFDTGVSSAVASDDIGITVDNVFVSTQEEAYNTAARAFRRAQGAYQTIAITVPGVKAADIDPRKPESGIGLVAGSRVVYDGQFYRVRTASFSESGMVLTADADTVVADAKRCYAAAGGLTVAQATALYAGFTVRDFKADPLIGADLGG